MDKQEAFDFLELKATATEAEIRKRLEEKQRYFEQLSATAPGDFLQKLHRKNIEKVQAIRELLFPSGAAAAARPGPPVGDSRAAYVQEPPRQAVPVAWLICHTEQQSARPHALFAGENYIGREAMPGRQSVLLQGDPYISRLHAVLEVQGGAQQQVFLQDAAAITGKPSKNGVYVNGGSQRIQERVQLQENDTVQVGVTKLMLRFNREVPVSRMVEEVSNTEYIKTVVIDLF